MLSLLGAGLYGYADGPPPAHTGGFGEPTCYACHFDGPETPSAGSLTLDGLPAAYEPGAGYLLTVTLAHPGLGAAGFQLSARLADGQPAGTLTPGNARVQVQHVEATGMVYAAHTKAGTGLTAPDTARWTLRWTAPTAGGPVVFHLAANAANGDDSAFGDVIHTRADTTAPAPGR
ncbi:hypothetical protein GQ464_006280 [Rhodocaloribacter litoris]|nr:hypothetical protein GQ464_006280 [Rhodocaloribacter litoris]